MQAAAAALPKDNGPSPEVLAEIQKKLEEAQLLSAKNTAAAAEEAAKKEAEANMLAKKKSMQTLQVIDAGNCPAFACVRWVLLAVPYRKATLWLLHQGAAVAQRCSVSCLVPALADLCVSA